MWDFEMQHENGSMKEWNNNKTIAVFSHTSGILLIIILNIITIQAEYELSKCQAGYRPDRDKYDMLFIMQTVLDKFRNNDTEKATVLLSVIHLFVSK